MTRTVSARRLLADLSRLLNGAFGGEPGRTICWSIAMRHGPDCLFCRAIGWLLGEHDHCRDEFTAQDTITWLKSRK